MHLCDKHIWLCKGRTSRAIVGLIMIHRGKKGVWMTFKSERPNLSVTYKYRETHGFKGKWTGDKCPTLCLKTGCWPNLTLSTLASPRLKKSHWSLSNETFYWQIKLFIGRGIWDGSRLFHSREMEKGQFTHHVSSHGGSVDIQRICTLNMSVSACVYARPRRFNNGTGQWWKRFRGDLRECHLGVI